MILKATYLLVFLGGLALSVHVMLHGVERWQRRRSPRPSAVLNPPTVAAFGLGIGASGYLFSSRSDLPPLPIFAISLLIGSIALAGMIFLMAKWALRKPSLHHEEDDVNGQVATVTRAITMDEPGEITWYAWDSKHVLPASSLGQDEVPVGTEVVIDVVEDGVARVELWAVVERRL